MKILLIGGDGFCGWPTSLRLSSIGHEVLIVDDLSRRRIDEELEVSSLTPIESIQERCNAWHELTGKSIFFKHFCIGEDLIALERLIGEYQPDTIIHFAEQRSAPYSMRSSLHRHSTIMRNIGATHHILMALVSLQLDAHVIHLGTLGVYDYNCVNGVTLPDGYIKAALGEEQESTEILFPTKPSSIYHVTKSVDQLLFQFYNQNDGLRITDLHQGIVWGTQTEETKIDDRLINRFDYDGNYGTVLNRFLMQAVVGHPLTIYGLGTQKRAFVHISDTVDCIVRAVDSPPEFGERVCIMNQVSEIHRIVDLANIVSGITSARISFLMNPRPEIENNELRVRTDALQRLGFKPTMLSEGLLEEVTDIARRHANRCDKGKILPDVIWNAERRAAIQAEAFPSGQQFLNHPI
ncbi:MAG: NAD-dependent epimerase/dehydratase family protein [Hyphomicrobiaceae bacterium]